MTKTEQQFAPDGHSIISPSNAHRWAHCPGSVPFTKDMPDRESSDSTTGVKAHDLAARLLAGEQDPERLKDEAGTDMWDNVQTYVRAVQHAALSGTLFVEQELDLSEVLCLPDGKGTADAIILLDDLIEVHDLKYGYTPVEAEGNEQLMLYGLGAFDVFRYAGFFSKVKLVIHQPRLERVREWTIDTADLLKWGLEIQSKAKFALNQLDMDPERWIFAPGDKQCQWCKGKASCKALTQRVQEATTLEFDNLDETIPAGPKGFSNEELAQKFIAIQLIEKWIKAVEKETFERMMAGQAMPGLKLINGVKGARSWEDPAKVEALFKKMRLKTEEMYQFKLISPTKADELRKAGVIGPRQWPQVEELYDRADGKPKVALESSKHKAISPTVTADDFDDVSDLA